MSDISNVSLNVFVNGHCVVMVTDMIACGSESDGGAMTLTQCVNVSMSSSLI